MGKARYNTNGKNIEYALPIGFIGINQQKFLIHFRQLGNNKTIGNGYRSLLLSDVAYSYPYFKMQTHISKFTFQTIWSQFVDASKNWVSIQMVTIKNLELLIQLVIPGNKKCRIKFISICYLE